MGTSPFAAVGFGIRTKLIALLLVFGLIPSLALYGALLSRSEGLQELMEQRVELAAHEISDVIHDGLLEHFADLRSMALNPIATSPWLWDKPNQHRVLVNTINSYIETHGVYTMAMLVGLDGRVVAANTVDAAGRRLDAGLMRQLSFAGYHWFEEARHRWLWPARYDPLPRQSTAGTSTLLGRPSVEPLVARIIGGDGVVLPMVTPVRNTAGEPVGFWINLADFRLIERIVARAADGEARAARRNRDIMVLDEKGRILVDWPATAASASVARRRYSIMDRRNLADQGHPAAVAAVNGDNGSVVAADASTGAEAVVGYAHFAGADDFHGPRWSVLVSVPKSHAFAIWYDLVDDMMLVLIAASSLILAAGYALGSGFVRPIRRLTAAMTALARGEVRHRICHTARPDEIGEMARAAVIFRDSMERTAQLAIEQHAKKQLEALVDERTRQLAEANVELEGKRADLEAVLRTLPVGVMLVEAPDARLIMANKAMASLMNWDDFPVAAGERALTFGCLDDLGRKLPMERWPLQRALRGEVVTNEELAINRSDGSRLYVSVSATAIKDGDGRTAAGVMVVQDMTQRRAAELRVRELAHYDPLTKLPNRWQLHELLGKAVSRAEREARSFAFMLIDLDNFKDVNDTLGHSVGDGLLAEVAHRLRVAVGERDVVARLGGDEFAVIVEAPTTAADVGALARRVVEAVAAPMRLRGTEWRPSASVGVALCPENAQGREALFAYADLALYAAKDAGRKTWRFFEPEMQERAASQAAVDRHLHTALERGEFVLHYQPIVDVDSLRPYGFEALVRWAHPERGLIAPDAFIPTAERNGVIVPLTQWAVSEALRQAAHWRDLGLGPIRVSVNVPAASLEAEGLVEHVADRLQAESIPPQALVLEVTEGVIAKEGEVMPTLHALRRLGVAIAVDDFGAGYSSLARLQNLPLDIIKIDRGFLDSSDEKAEAILQATVDLAKGLELAVMVEGVETEAHLAMLRAVRAACAQGFLFARPMEAARVPAWLRRHQGGAPGSARKRPRQIARPAPAA